MININPPDRGPEETGGEVRDRVRQTADDVKERARHAADDARVAASDAAARLKESAKSAGEQLKNRATQTGEDLRIQGRAYVDEQKDRAADEVAHLSAAVRGAADRLHQTQDDQVAHYAEVLADRIDGASNYLRSRDATGMWEDTQDFARRRPEVVIGAMFVAGLAIARVLKASSQQRSQYQSGEYGEASYDEAALASEAALDADAQSAGSHLPATPTGTTRPFEAGGFSTVTSSNPTGATPAPPPGAAPSSTYNPAGAEDSLSAPDSEVYRPGTTGPSISP